MLIQVAGYKQIGIQYRAMLFQIPFPQPSIFPKRGLLGFTNYQIGNEVISDLSIRSAHLLKDRFA